MNTCAITCFVFNFYGIYDPFKEILISLWQYFGFYEVKKNLNYIHLRHSKLYKIMVQENSREVKYWLYSHSIIICTYSNVSRVSGGGSVFAYLWILTIELIMQGSCWSCFMQACVWACSWQCVSSPAMFSDGKVSNCTVQPRTLLKNLIPMVSNLILREKKKREPVDMLWGGC